MEKIKDIFKISIYESFINGHTDLNSDLIKLSNELYSIHRNFDPKDKSNWNYNCGIWTSNKITPSILDTDKEPLVRLRFTIVSEVHKYLETLNCEYKHISLRSSWININVPGQFQESHTHLGKNHLSGTYFIDVPENSGNLIFEHPNTLLYYWLNSRNPLGYKCDALPGKLVIFPSWLHHFVQKNGSDRNRISLSFNVYVHN